MTRRVYHFVVARIDGRNFCPIGAALIQEPRILLMEGNLYEVK